MRGYSDSLRKDEPLDQASLDTGRPTWHAADALRWRSQPADTELCTAPNGQRGVSREPRPPTDMTQAFIFDLSDVLVVGLTGIGDRLEPYLPYSAKEILRQLRSGSMLPFLLGEITEEEYLLKVLGEFGWSLGVEDLKAVVREHFRTPIPGSSEIVAALAQAYPLYLLSDHGREWASYIEGVHPFLALFQRRFYSFDLHMRKNDPLTYREVLRQIREEPANCLFVDDKDEFLRAGAEVGLSTLIFKGSHQLRRELLRRSVLV
jgi:FMN phosphatase YigB (HAD superfamily)